MKRTSVMLPDDLAAVLELEAQRRGITASVVIREALTRYVWGQAGDRRVPAFVGLAGGGRSHDAASRAAELLDGLLGEVERDAFGGER
ncbi:MAG: ribbon-helix-helix domain-containing protein [Chloroflexota bacterium]